MKLAFSTAAIALVAATAPALAQNRPQPQFQPVYQTAPLQAPATQASVANLDMRIVSLEQQISNLLRAEEENGHRIAQLEAQLKQQRDDSSARIAALEGQLASGAAPAQSAAAEPVEQRKPTATLASLPSKPKLTNAVATTSDAAATDPAEDAYDVGYQLWKSGKYDEAVGALRAFTSSYPQSHRVSWANNLAGRALLDKGEPRAAAEVLLANYRSNPKGERAADSLYYLGQSLMKLKQPSQACKAYAELEGVYGSTMRADLKKMLGDAKAEAKCD
jgi:TolA-binding protein